MQTRIRPFTLTWSLEQQTGSCSGMQTTCPPPESDYRKMCKFHNVPFFQKKTTDWSTYLLTEWVVLYERQTNSLLTGHGWMTVYLETVCLSVYLYLCLSVSLNEWFIFVYMYLFIIWQTCTRRGRNGSFSLCSLFIGLLLLLCFCFCVFFYKELNVVLTLQVVAPRRIVH